MNEKVVLITGAGTGLGRSTALHLASQGYQVYATIHHEKDKSFLLASGLNQCLQVRLMDVVNNEQIQKVIDEIEAEKGRLDIIINNAAKFLLGPPDSASTEEIRAVFDVNVVGVVQVVRAALPLMKKRDRGHILTISSISGVESSSYMGIYAASKFAIEAIMESWAAVLNQWNIKLSLIQPGAMDTSLADSPAVGSYYQEKIDDPYKVFNKNSAAYLKNILRAYGADTQEVARLIQKAIESENPLLRYQTCEFSTNLVLQHLKDPEKISWLKEHRALVSSFF